MSLLCKKINKIEKFFTDKLKNQISSLNNEKNLLNFPKDLNTSIRIYLNLTDLNTNDNYIKHIKENFLQKIINDVKLQDNFGNKGYFESLKILLIEFNKNPSPTIKEKLASLLNEINSNVEMFQKQQMENLVKSIQENSNIYEIKTGIKNFNLFPKKLIKSRLINTLAIPKSDDYNINVDIENNMIVLQDKKLEDNLIVFAELTHNGIPSINFYNSLMNTVKPNLIFLEQEPFEIYEENNTNYDPNQIKFAEYKDKFSHFQEFRNYLKDNHSDRNYIVKGADFIYNDKKEIMEIESIIFNALNKNIKVNLFDLNHQEYLNTFLFNNDNSEKNNKLEFFNAENKKVISILNNLEISAWINIQTIKGCKNCTSFLTRNEIDWNPLSLEHVISKRNLPNYNESLLLKSKKIFDKIKENKNQKYIIFSSDSLNLVKNFIEFSNKNSKEKENAEKFFNNFNKHYVKEFSLDNKNLINLINNNDIKKENTLENYFDILSCGLLLKEKYYIYSKNPPFKIKNSEKDEFIRLYKKYFLKNFDMFFNLENANKLDFEDDNNNELILDKNEKTMIKIKDCSPFNYFQNIKSIRENMI